MDLKRQKRDHQLERIYELRETWANKYFPIRETHREPIPRIRRPKKEPSPEIKEQRRKRRNQCTRQRRMETNWYSRNAEKQRANARAYYAAHKEEQRAKGRERNRVLRESVLKHYGARCACCGETELAFLAIDHINGDGADHRQKIGKGGHAILYWLRDNGFPDGFQVLCHNCNMAKALYGVCPHQERKDE